MRLLAALTVALLVAGCATPHSDGSTGPTPSGSTGPGNPGKNATKADQSVHVVVALSQAGSLAAATGSLTVPADATSFRWVLDLNATGQGAYAAVPRPPTQSVTFTVQGPNGSSSSGFGGGISGTANGPGRVNKILDGSGGPGTWTVTVDGWGTNLQAVLHGIVSYK